MEPQVEQHDDGLEVVTLNGSEMNSCDVDSECEWTIVVGCEQENGHERGVHDYDYDHDYEVAPSFEEELGVRPGSSYVSLVQRLQMREENSCN